MTGTNRSRQVIESITQAAQQAAEGQPKPVSPDSAPAKRDRKWEQAHRAIPLRLTDADIRWLRAFADSNATPMDAAGRGLIRAIREAVEKGWVTFTVEQEIEPYEDTLGRQRTRVRTELESHWQIPPS